ncbi:uncharacterized protein ARMOST_10072 [Armillaria ostoyae]|uniref:Retrotransposon gag domain-containing protein n=1 Tax=Armillaria ostoyae TaxID=47428 RepID=A0A284RDD0_ARMOS|nr:uncharacterized protein ARMOST_10072 [Armillaria ostoyae]
MLNNPQPNTIHTKVKEPDTFDDLDPQKLKAFIVFLQLNFNNRPAAFATDASKVNYAISFLSSTALDWFEPDILHLNLQNLLAWQYSYAAFLDELRTNFSPFDTVRDAEDALEHLQMCDGDQIMKYIVQFNQYTSQRTEIFYENQNNKASGSYSNNLKFKGSSSNSNSLASGSTLKSSDSNSLGSAFTPKPYADKLGKDGHLTQEEKDCHWKNNLCMFYEGKHKTNDCNKHKATASAKGPTTEVEDSAPASEKPV